MGWWACFEEGGPSRTNGAVQIFTQSDLARYGVTLEEVEGLIDVVRRTSEAEVAAVFKEGADGVIRVSLRSLGAVVPTLAVWICLRTESTCDLNRVATA